MVFDTSDGSEDRLSPRPRPVGLGLGETVPGNGGIWRTSLEHGASKNNRLKSLLGMTLDERRLTVTVTSRSLGGFKLTQSLQATLTLDP